MSIRSWWLDKRMCCCEDYRSAHRHYRSRRNPRRLECSMCDCERFQWRLLKWVY
jgi:hypothetical protein